MQLFFLIPAYNEAANLPVVVAELRAHYPDAPILIVDDASEDGTAELLPTLGVRWMHLPVRLGVGNAVRAGLRYAVALGPCTVVRLDGDGQHRAVDVEALTAPLRDGRATTVIGSRYLRDGIGAPLNVRRLLQWLLAKCLTFLTSRRITDPTSGFWAFGPYAADFLASHHPTGYPEPELLLLLARNGLEFVEVPIVVRDRLAGSSSLTRPQVGIALARVLLAMVVVPFRALIPRQHHE